MGKYQKSRNIDYKASRGYRKAKFKENVLANCKKRCENPNCSNMAYMARHFFKASIWPECEFDPDNGMGVCGICYDEIECRIREGQDETELYPKDRYKKILEKSIECLF